MHLTSKILFVVGLLAIVALARPEHRDASHSDESTEGDKDRMINRCLFGGIPCSDNLVCLPFDWRCLVDPSCSDRHGSCVPKPPHWDKKSEADEMQKDMKKERDESLTDNELEEIKFVLKEHQPKPYHDDDLTICPGEHVLTATGGDPILSHSSYVQLTTEIISSSFRKHLCGGFAVHPYFFISAAHCVYDSDYIWPWYYMALKEGIVNKVVKTIKHENYTHGKSNCYNCNDLALLKVEKPFAHYTPIRKIDEDEKGVKSCVVRTLSESYSGCPVEIMIGVRSSTVCRYYALQLKDENAGDSGSPMICRFEDNQEYALGIISYGPVEDESQYPVYYTRLSRYESWVNEKIAQNEGS